MQDKLQALATQDVLIDIGTLSPNLYLYTNYTAIYTPHNMGPAMAPVGVVGVVVHSSSHASALVVGLVVAASVAASKILAQRTLG